MPISALVAFVLLAVFSWIAGWFAYIVVLRLLFHQVMSAGDRTAVAIWSASLFGVSIICVIWPLLVRFASDSSGRRRRLYIAVSGSLCGLVPTMLLGCLWGAQSFTAPEILLFATLFCVASATFATGYATLFK